MKKYLPTIITLVIFLCGLILFLYPTVSNLYNEYMNEKMVVSYEKEVNSISKDLFNEEKKNAKLYNKYMRDTAKLKELGLTYENVLNPTKDGGMGYIEIPKISVTLMIYHSVDEDNLQDGLGHVKETALPIGGESTHSVIAGHTGLPSAKLLTNLDRLTIGDKFYIHVLDEVLTYRVDNIAVVEPEDSSLTRVVKGQDNVTIVTCTPYGINSHRLLVRGVRVGNNSGGDEELSGIDVEGDAVNIEMKFLITYSAIGIVLIVLAVYKLKNIFKKLKKGGVKDDEKYL